MGEAIPATPGYVGPLLRTFHENSSSQAAEVSLWLWHIADDQISSLLLANRSLRSHKESSSFLKALPVHTTYHLGIEAAVGKFSHKSELSRLRTLYQVCFYALNGFNIVFQTPVNSTSQLALSMLMVLSFSELQDLELC